MNTSEKRVFAQLPVSSNAGLEENAEGDKALSYHNLD